MFGWLGNRKRKEVDYETMLEKIDSDIRQCELDITSISIAKRRISSAWISYSMSFYIVACSIHIFMLRTSSTSSYPEGREHFLIQFLKAFIILAGPFFIYVVRKLIFKWFDRQRQIKVELLAELRGRQQLKVEELKKKTQYYVTKGLIERYETPTKEKTRKTAEPNGSTNIVSRAINGHKIIPGNAGVPINSTPTSKNNIPAPRPVQASPLVKRGPPPIDQTPLERTWVDRILDAIVGEADGPQHKFALICESCFIHNGLVGPVEYNTTKFKCLKCGHFNQKNLSIRSPYTSTILHQTEMLMETELKADLSVLTKEIKLRDTIVEDASVAGTTAVEAETKKSVTKPEETSLTT